MASRSLGTLTLDLIAKIGGFQKGMDQAARIADSRSRSINRAMGGLSRTFAGLFAGISGGLLVRRIVQATAEAETAQAELRSALEATGNAAGFTQDQLTDFASTLQQQTRFGDEAIVELQTTLLRFGHVAGEEFTRATELSLDLATAMKIDLVSAGKLLGQALENPVRGVGKLRKAGVELEESQVGLIKRLQEAGQFAAAQGILLDSLSTIQGRAAASADTFGGALEQVKNAFDELFEASAGGSDEAKEALQELRDLLSDPAFKQSAQDLGAAVFTAMKVAAEGIAEVVRFVKFLGEELARLGQGPSLDDPIGIQREIDRIEEIRQTLVTDPLDRLRFFGRDGLVEWYSDADLDRELARLKQLLASASPLAPPVLDAAGRPVPGATGAGTGAAAPLPPSEDFLKIKEQLEQQIALFGAVGEAAKLRYQVEHELIEGITEAEGRELVRIAERLDAKAREVEQTKEREQAQLQLQKAYDDQLDAYTRQIALTGEINELERIRFEIAEGKLKGINQQEALLLETRAAEIDRQAALNDQLDRARQIYEDTQDPLDALAERLEEIKRLYESGAFEDFGGAETVVKASQQAVEDFQLATEEINAFTDQAKRNMQDILGDLLADGLEADIDEVLKNFGRMLAQMAAQAIAADIGSKIFGSPGGSSGPSLTSQFGNFITGLFTRDSGGRGTPGQPVVIGAGAQPELFVPDSPGTFIPNADRLGGENHFHFSFPGSTGQVSRLTMMQMSAAVARSAAEAARRNN